jgi:hypothetical protein
MTLLEKIRDAQERRREARLAHEKATQEFGRSIADELSPDYYVWYKVLGEKETGEPSAVYAIFSRSGDTTDDGVCFAARVIVAAYATSLGDLCRLDKVRSSYKLANKTDVVLICPFRRRADGDATYEAAEAKPIDFDREELIQYLI